MWKQIKKALVGGFFAGAAALGTAAQDGTVTSAEWLTVGGAALVGGYAVYKVRNQPAPFKATEQDDGQ